MNSLFSITFVVSEFPSISQTFIALQLDELLVRGYRVVIVCLGPRGEKNFLPESLQKKHASLEVVNSAYRLQNGKWKKRLILCGNIFFNLILTPIPSLKLFRALMQNGNKIHFKQTHVDARQFKSVPETKIVHCQFSTLASQYERLLRFGFVKKNRKKLAVSIRGFDISEDQHVFNTDWQALFGTFDLFLPVCSRFETRLRELGCGKPIAIAGSPVNTAELRMLSKNKVPNDDAPVKIVSLCRLVEKKGLDTAIEAITRVVRIHGQTDFHYTIIGSGPFQKYLEQTIERNNIGAYVTLAGKKPTTEALREMATAEILLAPSKTASDGNSEGIPNVIKEAMALGLAVVSTTHSGIPELITHGVNGFLVPENDANALADIIASLITDANLREAVTRSAPQRIYDSFSPEITTDNLISLYQSIIND